MIIFLTGYMACGKTTLGRALAQRGLADFVDLDEYIVERTGRRVGELISREGESAFRAAEYDSLSALVDERVGKAGTLVVGCGGGTACNARSMDKMKSNGLTVWLRTTVDRIVERLEAERGDRPLLGNATGSELRAFVSSHMAEREKCYARSDEEFDSTFLDSADEIERTVAEFSRRFITDK